MNWHINQVKCSGLGHAGLNNLTAASAVAKGWEDELGEPTCEVAEHVAAVGIEFTRVVVVQAPAGVVWGPAGPGIAFAPGVDERGLCLLPRLRL